MLTSLQRDLLSGRRRMHVHHPSILIQPLLQVTTAVVETVQTQAQTRSGGPGKDPYRKDRLPRVAHCH